MACALCDAIRSTKFPVLATERFIAIYDTRPQKRTHLLVLPLAHCDSIERMSEADVSELFLTALRVVRELRLQGYRLLVNVGLMGGQRIPHVAVHVLSEEATCPRSS